MRYARLDDVDRVHACGGGTGVAKDIEVYAHYGQRVRSITRSIGSWFVECFQTREDHRRDSWTNATNTLR
jgi:hypothetical protein